MYFEDLKSDPDKEIGSYSNFEMASNKLPRRKQRGIVLTT